MNDHTDTKLAVIEGKIDRGIANLIPVSRGGSVGFKSMGEVMEMAKLMCVAQQAIPKHLREQPGLCLGVIMQAVAWEMEPFAVANKSFVVNDRLAYESQLVHAVIEARAPLAGRLRCTYAGEGDKRTCTVRGTFKGESEPHEYTTPELAKIPVKNSPLWKWDVDQQLFYFASRAWARKWCPDVLLGVYTPDEAKYAGEFAADVTEHADEDVVHNPLGGDDDLGPPTSGTVAVIDGKPATGTVVTPTEPAGKPKRRGATKPPAAPNNAQAASQGAPGSYEPGRVETAHPDDIKVPPPITTQRWTGADYVSFMSQWCVNAVAYSKEHDDFLLETYVRDRHKREATVRNNIGTLLTAIERERMNEIARAASKGQEW